MFTHKYAPTMVVICLMAGTVALGAYTYGTLKQADMWGGPTTISVSGTGEVVAIPDVATFSFSVRAEGDDASSAQSESATKINAIMAFLKEKGIAESDIKTQGYNLYPRYKYEEIYCPVGRYCPNEPVQNGFEVNQTVTVKVREIEKAGDLLSGVGEQGATDISGLTFTIDDTDALKAEARELAINDAREKAKVLADNLGVKLGDLNGFYEDEGSFSPYAYGMGAEMSMKASDAMVSPEIPTGEEKVTSKVSLTFEIK